MRTTLAKVLLALTVAAAIEAGDAYPARAQVQFDARYTLAMAGIEIGKVTWRTQITANDYTTSANGRVTGILSILVSGEGNVTVKGRIKDGRPQPASFVSAVNREDEKTAVQMTFDGSRVRDLKVDEPPHESDRVPIADAHKLGVVDPLTAFLIPGSDDPAARDGCARNLAIFDGRRRYELALSFKRTDTIKNDSNKLSTVLVCAVKFMPISGHRTSSPLVKLLSEGRDIEIWLVPVAGTRILAPVRMAVASLVGTMVLQADQFETTALAASGK